MHIKINLENIQTLKLEALRREINIGIKQLESGEYTEYDEESLGMFLEDIKARWQQKLVDRDAGEGRHLSLVICHW
jgi:hypothetical protein